MLFLGIAAGMMIGFGAVTANTASSCIENPSLARVAGGLLFPFGLGMVMLLGTELFTGNCMIVISVLSGETSWRNMLRNWVCVYTGNMIGSVLLAAGIIAAGQLNLGGGALAVYTIKVAAGKCDLAFIPAVVLGIFCNVLVCLGVLCSLSAKDTAGRILGAYIPVVFFVICGFEHSIANMYYIPAGIMAVRIPEYAAFAAKTGLDISALGWANFFKANLVPVTAGNVIGGACIAAVLWFCHSRKASW
jgi:formate/nitrite transporter